MRLRIDIAGFEVKKIFDQTSNPSDCIDVSVSLSPHVRISLSHPGVSYIGAPMVAEAQVNGLLKFTCNERPFKFSDNQLWEQKWPSGGWHFLNILNAVEGYLAKELPGTYSPLLKKTIFYFIDDFLSKHAQ